MASVKVTLDKKRWTVEETETPRDRWGECCYGERIIRVHPLTRKRGNRREILIHEFLHAIFPYLSEADVTRSAKELDVALAAMGEKAWQPRKRKAA